MEKVCGSVPKHFRKLSIVSMRGDSRHILVQVRNPHGRIRVLHAAEVIKGGICSYLSDLTSSQCADESILDVGCVVPDSQKAELKTPLGVRVIGFADNKSRIRNAVALAYQVLSQVKTHPPDVLHVHSTFAGIAIRLLLGIRKQRPALVYCPHGWSFERNVHGYKKLIAKLVERNLARLCDVIVCVAEYERRAAIIAGIPQNKLVVIRNGIKTLETQSRPSNPIDWPTNRRRLLFVGRFDRQKGVDILLEALKHLDSAAFAYIVGGSVSDVELPSIPRNGKNVGWLTASELERYYQTTEIVVIPSRWEGLPIVALEAMRAGRAVIAARVGGIPELIEHGRSGVLINSDSPIELAAAINSLTTQRIEAIGAAANLRVREMFDSKKVHEELLRVYHETCDAGAVRKRDAAAGI